MRRHIELGADFDELLRRVERHEPSGALVGSAPLPPSPSPPSVWVRGHHDGGHVDRPVFLTAEEELDLERWSRTVASKPSAAGADDGTRAEAVPTEAAVEGHGWSVSATRTLGNVPEQRVASFTWARAGGWRAETLDAVRDEPVLPDPEPEANVGAPTYKPTIRTTRDDCPTCKRPQRERGETRVHYWACGCAIEPYAVGPVWVDQHGDRVWSEPDDADREGGRVFERLWYADMGDDREAPYRSVIHPTEAGAIAAWRTALAELQRREDEDEAIGPRLPWKLSYF